MRSENFLQRGTSSRDLSLAHPSTVCVFTRDFDRWQALSPAAKDLLMGMLAYNTKHRLTAQQVRHTATHAMLPKRLRKD